MSETKEKTFDDATPDKTAIINIQMTAQQAHILYWVGCEFNDEERSQKLDRVLSILKDKLDKVNWKDQP